MSICRTVKRKETIYNMRVYYSGAIAVFFFFCFNSLYVIGRSHTDEKAEGIRGTYPVPPKNANSLFYIQRSKNTNAIVYELNKNADGSLNQQDPVKIYWIRYAHDSTTADLNYIQQKYAYGLNISALPGNPSQYSMNFVSYAKKKLYLMKRKDGSGYSTYTQINGKMAVLESVFITISGGTFWFPKIDDIELYGYDPESRQIVVEHFKP
ncbi:MAG: DUF4833 domain-containing protein [Bacteroidetes bacterium]|nr:MAG: DUF4833 domain-containing protein [Bacteroidota bacterium]